MFYNKHLSTIITKIVLWGGLLSLIEATPCPSNWTTFNWANNTNYACTITQTQNLTNVNLNLEGAILTCSSVVGISLSGLSNTLTNFTLLNCLSGGISNVGVTPLFVVGGRFINCTRGITSPSGPVTVTNSFFRGCSTIGNGGAIGTNTNVTAIDTVFESCRANIGGAVLGMIITLTRTNFLNCTANTNGGAVFALNRIVVRDSSFNSCNASTGGAIYLSPSFDYTSSSIGCSSFIGNRATIGGAIYIRPYGVNNQLDVTNTNFVNNTGNGSIVVTGTGYPVVITNWYSNGNGVESFSGPVTRQAQLPGLISCYPSPQESSSNSSQESSPVNSSLVNSSSIESSPVNTTSESFPVNSSSEESSPVNTTSQTNTSSQNISSTESSRVNSAEGTLLELIRWNESTTISQIFSTTSPLEIRSLNIVLSSAFEGPLITGSSASLSGTLYLDLTNYDLNSEDELWLFNFSQMEGTFEHLVIIGVDSCITGELGNAGTVYVINTCSTDASASLALF